MLKVFLVVAAFALVVWALARLAEQRRVAKQQPRVTGPDDDPDFLWKLERERRRTDDEA